MNKYLYLYFDEKIFEFIFHSCSYKFNRNYKWNFSAIKFHMKFKINSNSFNLKKD